MTMNADADEKYSLGNSENLAQTIRMQLSAVNVLPNNPKISHITKRDMFQLNISSEWWKIC